MNTYIVFIALAIVICDYYVTVNAYRKFEVAGTTTILSLENETVRIQCVTDVQMAYCGFIHPTGKRFSFSGQELIDGHCSIEIRATHADSGAWTCHIGKKRVGVEVEQTILLRVVGQVAAIQPSINVVHGKQVTLSCATTKTLAPLNYCRFEPPKGAPFSIDPEVKRTNAILGKYFFPENRSLDRGDCAVTIAAARYDDVGLWTCGAGLLNDEYTDVIKLDVQGLYTMSASVTGVTFGTIGIATFLAVLGYMAWKKRHMLGRGRVREEIEMAEPIQARSSVHSSTGSVRGSAGGTPRASPSGSPRVSVRGSAGGTPRASPSGSPRVSVRDSAGGTPRVSPRVSVRGSAGGTPRVSPSGSPRVLVSGSPVMARVIPTLVVQSPSEPSSSPKAV